MPRTSAAHADSSAKENFAALLEESCGGAGNIEGTVLKGKVIGIENDIAVIDVGLKSEGRVAVKEFAAPGQRSEIKVGDEVAVYLDRIEDKNGRGRVIIEYADLAAFDGLLEQLGRV